MNISGKSHLQPPYALTKSWRS